MLTSQTSAILFDQRRQTSYASGKMRRTPEQQLLCAIIAYAIHYTLLARCAGTTRQPQPDEARP
jgi:hypothetical protein